MSATKGESESDIPSVQRVSIIPVPKPRQTRSDQWKKRPSVMRYREFADHVRESGLVIPESGAHVVFYMPMPKSWSKVKRAEMGYAPHQQKPDLDNLLKALLDAMFEDDCNVWQISCEKRWSHTGHIAIGYIPITGEEP